MLAQRQYGMKRLVVTESLKILSTANTIAAIIIAQLSLFSNSTIDSITHPTFLERHHNCIMFHSPKKSVLQEVAPEKLVTLCMTAHILTFLWISDETDAETST